MQPNAGSAGSVVHDSLIGEDRDTVQRSGVEGGQAPSVQHLLWCTRMTFPLLAPSRDVGNVGLLCLQKSYRLLRAQHTHCRVTLTSRRRNDAAALMNQECLLLIASGSLASSFVRATFFRAVPRRYNGVSLGLEPRRPRGPTVVDGERIIARNGATPATHGKRGKADHNANKWVISTCASRNHKLSSGLRRMGKLVHSSKVASVLSGE